MLNLKRLDCVYCEGGIGGGEGIVQSLFRWISNIWFLHPENNAVTNMSFYKCCPGLALLFFLLTVESIMLFCVCV